MACGCGSAGAGSGAPSLRLRFRLHTAALNRLATSVEVMAAKQDTMADTQDRLDGKVETLESKPAKRWESLMEKVLLVLAGAFAAWVASGAPGI